jgi:hypothetical protein
MPPFPQQQKHKEFVMSHPLRVQPHSHAAAPPTPAWPSYKGTSQYIGVSKTGVSVWYDPSLGAPALQNATDLLADADRIRAANDAIFGTAGGPVDVIVFALGGATDGTGGADHMGCDYATGAQIEVCAAFGNSMRCSALFEAELSECSMNGNLCGLSTGEALSRWCAMLVGNNALADFTSVSTWVHDGEANWVNRTEGTDQHYDSIGCGMAFLSWLQKLGHALPTIAQEMVKLGNAGTLEALYASVTGDAAAHAWTKFRAALAGAGVSLTTDDPFGAMGQSPPPPSTATPTLQLSGSLPMQGPSGSTSPVTLQGVVTWP